jgi:hypothetical protein
MSEPRKPTDRGGDEPVDVWAAQVREPPVDMNGAQLVGVQIAHVREQRQVRGPVRLHGPSRMLRLAVDHELPERVREANTLTPTTRCQHPRRFDGTDAKPGRSRPEWGVFMCGQTARA